MTDIDLSSAHARLRASNPLIQCITNTVVQQFSANVLLAVGASPAMLDHDADAAQFAHLAGGLLVNFGTATNQQFLAADAAVDAVTEDAKPWVLDPVSIGAADHRTTRIRRAAAAHPTAIRGNASEIAALA
ncbi:hydroxyethylthiazole kinase, partial [Geobacillus sp. MMMUD3]|nr:hydroxyethylthiazole kinase [Geobacillus sp. MMMUD3]